jgi:TRAP-type C4-dicarboxylate transport system substrate-binding protein
LKKPKIKEGNMRKKLFSGFGVAVFVLFAGQMCLAAETIKLKYSNFFPPVAGVSGLVDQFCEDVNKRTEGRVEISSYHGGTLLSGPRTFDGVVQGISDIGLSNTAYTRGRFPVSEVLELPLGFSSAYVSGHVCNDFLRKFEAKEWGMVHVMHYFSPGPFVIQTINKPIKTLEDLKGLKIRAPGMLAEITKSLGATPMPLEMIDVYEALRRGVLDGILTGLEPMKSFKIGEVLKYVTLSSSVGSAAVFFVVMNKDKWNSLPADVKKVLDDEVERYKDKFLRVLDDGDADGLNFFKSNGGQTVTLSNDEYLKWSKAVQPVIMNYRKDMISKGYSGEEIDSYVNFIKERIEYWKKIQKDRKIESVIQ